VRQAKSLTNGFLPFLVESLGVWNPPKRGVQCRGLLCPLYVDSGRPQCAKFRTLRRSPEWTFMRWLEWPNTRQERFFFVSSDASSDRTVV